MITGGSTRGDLVVALGPVDDDIITRHLGRFGPLVTADTTAATRLEALLPGAVGIIARGTSVIDAALMDAAPRLRVIGRSGVGVELVDLTAATQRGIPVVVTPGAGSNAVAEGALAMILHLVKRLGRLTALVRDGRWDARERVIPGDLDRATLGIIGYGRIGRRLAEMARALGMQVLASDPAVAPEDAAAAGVTLTSTADLVGRADVVSLHAPLTPETRGLVSEKLLEQFKQGAVLVNCARGGLLDQDAVLAALERGQLSGVGLDVVDPEPPPPEGHPLFYHPDVVITPHVHGMSQRARRQTFEDMAAGMAAVLAGRRPAHVANPEVFATAGH